MTEEKMRVFAEMLVRWQPMMFRAYASALSLFAEYIREKRITGIRPKLIETTAEKVSEQQRQLLEDVFQCPVADWYTARELGTIAFQCPSGGLHISETRYLEVIANGKPAQPNQLGEVAITSTHQLAMPLIRYKLGDMAIFQSEPCPCGRGLPSLQEVVGRVQDFLVTADGRFVHGGYFPHTFRNWPEIFRYQVYQSDMKHLEVRLICKRDVDSLWLENLRKEIQHRFGEDMQIEIKLVDHFELTRAGKHRFIISDVKPDFVN
jgi:phenylacetate-CoA ligase